LITSSSSARLTCGESLRPTPSITTNCERMCPWVRIHRAIGRSSASASSLFSRSSAGCTTNTAGRSIQQGQASIRLKLEADRCLSRLLRAIVTYWSNSDLKAAIPVNHTAPGSSRLLLPAWPLPHLIRACAPGDFPVAPRSRPTTPIAASKISMVGSDFACVTRFVMWTTTRSDQGGCRLPARRDATGDAKRSTDRLLIGRAALAFGLVPSRAGLPGLQSHRPGLASAFSAFPRKH
jgi:hypothetical protein